MKRAARQIAVLALVLLAICWLSRLAMRDTYTAYIPVPAGYPDLRPEEVRVAVDEPDVLTPGAPEVADGYLRVPVQAEGPGETFLNISAGGDSLSMGHFEVGRFGTIYDHRTGGFTGDSLAMAAFTVFSLLVAVIMFDAYRGAKGPAFYAYSTIYAVGFGLFALFTGIFMLNVTLRHLVHPRSFIMFEAYDAISTSGFRFMMLTSPFMLAFAVAMAVSNVALLRHEGFQPKNALGIGVALLIVAGEALGVWLYSRDFSGSQWQLRVHNTLQDVYATGFAYFECILLGAIICGIKAAKHVPAPDADYILILGCRFRRDGTLTPLLRGRADRAIAFWRDQKAATGREAVLMPSGGQGDDESMPEAEAMRRYLLEQGVPEASIRAEDRSRNTYQNMAFSKAIIEKEHPGAKVVYATTNYHVFRSGVWAGLAGMPAEGVGSRTKWWYWPNAFMRECAGLLMNRVPQEVALLLLMIAFFGTLSMLLS